MHTAPSARRFLSLALITVTALLFSSCSTAGYGNTSSTTTPTTPTPPPPDPSAITVAISGPTTVAAGQTVTFTATVQNTTNTAVTWEAGEGTISSQGSFTAPNFPTYLGYVWVTAISQADPKKSAGMAVTIRFSDVSIQGPYAFSLSGTIANAALSSAGTLQLDGKGNITGGVADFNGSVGFFPNVPLTGSYDVGPDGRGTATLTSSLGTTHYRFVVTDGPQLQLIGFDAADSIHGVATPQDSSSLSLSGIAGNWSFFLSGSSGGMPFAEVGRFSVDSAGNITQGVEDSNNAGTVSSNASFTGSASSLSPTGRGTVSFTGSLGTSNFAFYVAPTDTVYFVEIDSGVFLSGSAYKQQQATYANSTLRGSYIFLLSGTDNLGGPVAQLGQIDADGTGHITGGVFDVNDNGALALKQAIMGGSYTVESNGRGTAIATSASGTLSYAFYLVSQSTAVFLEIDGRGVTQGIADQQQTGSPVSGSLGFASFGGSSSGGFESIGQIATDQVGNITAAVEDLVRAGTVMPNMTLSVTNGAGLGRGPAQFTTSSGTSNFIFYCVSQAEYKFLGVDPSEVIAGFVTLQSSIGYWDY